MVELEMLENYFEYIVWADNKLIEGLGELDDDEFGKSLDLGRSIKELVLHMVSMYEYYSIHSTGKTYDMWKNEFSNLTKEELGIQWGVSVRNFKERLEDNQEKMFKLPVGAGNLVDLSSFDWMMLFTDHTSYHRGQLMSCFKLLGKEGFGTDYLKFIVEKMNN